MVQCFMELSLSEEAITIYTVFCNKGFSKSIYIKSQMAKCYDNLRESQLSKQTFEEIRKLDPFNLDFMDIYSNILFGKYKINLWFYFFTAPVFIHLMLVCIGRLLIFMIIFILALNFFFFLCFLIYFCFSINSN
jgi:hypothetical protein